jgi:hypothetical protein
MADEIGDAINTALSESSSIISEHPLATIGAIAGSAIVGAGIVGLKISKSKKKSKKKNKKKVKRNSKKRKHKSHRKSKKRSSKRIRYTKNHQPYIILASGKARFISKRSASSSKKRKGGRY